MTLSYFIWLKQRDSEWNCRVLFVSYYLIKFSDFWQCKIWSDRGVPINERAPTKGFRLYSYVRYCFQGWRCIYLVVSRKLSIFAYIKIGIGNFTVWPHKFLKITISNHVNRNRAEITAFRFYFQVCVWFLFLIPLNKIEDFEIIGLSNF